MKDKIVIITGANRGIGKETAKELARLQARVYLACRSSELAQETKQEIISETGNKNIFNIELDLASFASIQKFTEEFAAKEKQLDVLVNNAGIMSYYKKLSQNGFELTFAINVLGHHFLTKLLIDHLAKAESSKIINVASDFAGGLNLKDVNFENRKYSLTQSYSQSKQANRMLTREWAKNLKKNNIRVYSMTPGFVPKTGLFRDQNFINKGIIKILGSLGGRTISRGSETIVWLASEENPGTNGGYFKDKKEVSCKFSNPAKEKELWELCESYLSDEFKISKKSA